MKKRMPIRCIHVRWRRVLGVGMFVVLCTLVGRVLAEESTPYRWLWSHSLSGSVNPLGLDLTSRISYQSPLYEGKKGILWDSTLWEVGIENSLTPAYDSLSLLFHIVPIAFFDLRVMGGLRYAYDALGFGYTPLAEYSSPFDGDTRKKIDRRSGLGFRYQVSPTLQGAWNNFIFASTIHWVFFDMRGVEEAGQKYFYEPSANVVLKQTDMYWGNDTILAYRFKDKGLLLGLIHSITYVPGSGYITERVSLVGNHTYPLLGTLGLSMSALVGFYPQDRYLSYNTGKLYGALQIRLQGRIK
ncbi:MAG: hypothetical protein N2442_14315 [Spirochaetes bacterium]|nr:hypothetical protein [Spirochaetota bacterium]